MNKELEAIYRPVEKTNFKKADAGTNLRIKVIIDSGETPTETVLSHEEAEKEKSKAERLNDLENALYGFYNAPSIHNEETTYLIVQGITCKKEV